MVVVVVVWCDGVPTIWCGGSIVWCGGGVVVVLVYYNT